jgi:hypothetical protein
VGAETKKSVKPKKKSVKSQKDARMKKRVKMKRCANGFAKKCAN